MSLSENESDYLQRVLDAYNEDRKKCSEWERGFMDDQVKRWEEHGSGIRMSPKQWTIIGRVADKLGVHK
jgi:hypothetical protein